MCPCYVNSIIYIAESDADLWETKKLRKDIRSNLQFNYFSIVSMDKQTGQIRITKVGSNEPPKEFTFDSVYDWK